MVEALMAMFAIHPTCSALDRRLDLLLRKRAVEAAERKHRIDWMAQAEVVAQAQAENPLADVRLPVEVDGVPSPEAEEAAARDRERRIIYPDQE